MTDPDSAILDAAVRIFVRYGMRRATMADIAEEAGLSRQTLYDRFGGKDGIVVASIRHLGDVTCDRVQAGWTEAPGLAARLDIYFRIAVLEVFDMLQASPDADDVLAGQGPAAQQAARDAERRKRAMIADMLRETVPDLPPDVPNRDEIAGFVTSAAAQAKYSMTDRADLTIFLATLKAATLALTRTAL
ncbi:TetR/AcrR family transcriptional regulator [Roseisalinus antarcticus]|uniref:Transcriptional regulator BetI n=1 Tax=Roseisalinus antarcticus TaxID=254357 RepID=A0A1Y5TRI6_9RHOB|nr:TetR/AcrR family transcriptional regulator [Roseisalinus antarcticus]SLN68072.1 transcriptional regulator BetI [Roseisalinus antarcticus]